MAKEIVGDKGMDKEKCGHFGEYGYADGYYGRKYCRIDGCLDAVACSNKMKTDIEEHGGDYILAMVTNRGRGHEDRENEGKQRQQASKPGAKEIKEEKKPPEVKEEEKQFDCECIKCGEKVTSKEHCKDLKCPKCGGQIRRVGRPGPGQE
ncbi:MAG: hypothetical protein ACFFAU_01525 [Candidatus Hodarchaeota archaeon]